MLRIAKKLTVEAWLIQKRLVTFMAHSTKTKEQCLPTNFCPKKFKWSVQTAVKNLDLEWWIVTKHYRAMASFGKCLELTALIKEEMSSLFTKASCRSKTRITNSTLAGSFTLFVQNTARLVGFQGFKTTSRMVGCSSEAAQSSWTVQGCVTFWKFFLALTSLLNIQN